MRHQTNRLLEAVGCLYRIRKFTSNCSSKSSQSCKGASHLLNHSCFVLATPTPSPKPHPHPIPYPTLRHTPGGFSITTSTLPSLALHFPTPTPSPLPTSKHPLSSVLSITPPKRYSVRSPIPFPFLNINVTGKASSFLEGLHNMCSNDYSSRKAVPEKKPEIQGTDVNLIIEASFKAIYIRSI